MKRLFQIALAAFSIVLIIAVFFSNCSREISSSYEELEREGRIESVARETHKDFFSALQKFENAFSVPAETQPDSMLRKELSTLTDGLIESIYPFPSTVESRIAMDALSYAAKDLVESQGIDGAEISLFWDLGFMKPLFLFASDYMNSNDINDSAHLQIIKVLSRGMGSNATDQMVVDCISVVGVVPSDDVMEYCKADSVLFKKVHDLIIFTRSLQTVDPPSWMLSGDWFLPVEFNGLPVFFIAITPDMVGEVPYLSFKDFNQGEVYAAVFDDPVPDDKAKWESWLARADGVMRSADFDGSISGRVRDCGLTTYDAHNFYDDYLFHTAIDTTLKEFRISLVRKKDETGAFEFAGQDSITIIFSSNDYYDPDAEVRELNATRILGASMANNNFLPGKNYSGRAFMMPLGVHDKNKVTEYLKSQEPEFTVDVN